MQEAYIAILKIKKGMALDVNTLSLDDNDHKLFIKD